jgi:hypothetical protein
MISKMNEFHGIDICDNAFKLTFNKTFDFDIVDWASARSLMLVLEIKLVVIHELMIMNESAFESDEIAMLV